MTAPSISQDELERRVGVYLSVGKNQTLAAEQLGITRSTLQHTLKRAGEQGLLGTQPVLPGMRISQTTSTPNGDYVQQRPEFGPEFEPTDGLAIKGKTTLVSPDGRIMHQHIMERTDAAAERLVREAALEGFRDAIPRAGATPSLSVPANELLSQYTVTDVHLGALAWAEETGGGDYDLAIGERLLVDWFAAAIEMAPPSTTAILAQIGDFLHHDSFESVTPAHRNILDADSRYPKMVRVAIRALRQIVAQLLTKHQFVHIIMADANHDPASEVWLREMFAALYEDEPRVTVDRGSGTYYVYQHGDVSLFFHHGHRRKIDDVDSVFAGRFREIYGSTKFSYAHLGHLHSDALKSTNLMKVERHETLAAPDAYAANGGWLAGRSAKVITYSKQFGEVARQTLTPEMVAAYVGAPANDNQPRAEAA